MTADQSAIEPRESLTATRREPGSYRNLVEASAVAQAVVSDGIIRWANAAAARLTGCAAEDLMGRDVAEFIHPDDLDALAGVFDAAGPQPTSRPDFRVRVRHVNGDWLWMTGSVAVESDTGHLLVSGVDVSREADVEQRLADMEQTDELIHKVGVRFLASEEGEFERALSDVLDLISFHLGAERSFVVDLDLETRTTTPRYDHRAGHGIVPLPPGMDLTFNLDDADWGFGPLLVGEALVADDPSEMGNDTMLGTWMRARGLRWTRWYPMQLGGRLSGAIGLFGVGDPPDPRLNGPLGHAADLAASAKARHVAEQRLQRRVHIETLAKEIYRRLNREHPDHLRHAVRHVLGEVGTALGADHGRLYLASSSGRLRPQLSWDAIGLGVTEDDPIDVRGSEFHLGKLPRMIVLNTLDDLGVERMDQRRVLEEHRVGAMVCAALEVAGRRLGHLIFTAEIPRIWDPATVTLLELATEATANALERAVLHVELEQRAAELANRNAELERSNQALESFATVAAHDLKAPLAAEKGLLRVLERQGGELGDDLRHLLQRAAAQADRLADIVDDHLAGARPSDADQTQTADLGVCLEAARESLDALIYEAEAELVGAGQLPTVAMPGSAATTVLRNLVQNALKFRRRDRVTRITVSARVEDERVVLDVCDNGIGIPEADWVRVFDLHGRAHSDAGYPGTGLGLATCRRLVEQHGGRIWVSTSGEAGTTFSLELPAA